MNRKFAFIALVALGLGLAGCDDSGSRSTKVVVIDLQIVARSLQRDAEIQALINNANNQLATQLQSIAATRQKEFEDEKAKLPKEPTPEQAKQLADKGAALQQAVNANINEANTKFRQYQLGLIQRFRDEVKPAAQKIARERGAGLILIPTDSMLAFDPACDITHDVVEAMRSDASIKPWVSRAPAPVPGAAPAPVPAPGPAPMAPAAAPAPAAPVTPAPAPAPAGDSKSEPAKK
jgi:Skp family chaperone for outer membrane proteins